MHIYKETTKLFVTRATMFLTAIQHKFYIYIYPRESISSVDFLIERIIRG